LERDLLSTTHEAITERGYLTSDELSKIVTWKSQRTLGVLKRDPDIATRDDTIRDATRVALARETPEWMKHRILCFLYGVGHPVASAILTIWDPDNHTVIDVRTVGALRKLWELGLLDAEPPSRTDRYLKYLRVFRDIAKELVVSHRDLDRALWKWHREGMPETWPDTDAT
jgi:thermostable 8-oxoguanine DNA glycosylase